jgi:hypothetical protein
VTIARNQVEDDDLPPRVLDGLAEPGSLAGADSAAYAQDSGAAINGTNDPEHRD